MAVLGVDLGGTWVRLGISSSPPHIPLTQRVPLDELGVPLSLDALSRQIEAFLGGAEREGLSVTALGVSVAGVVEPVTGLVRRGENLGWQEVPLGEMLHHRFRLPVSVDTDVFCGAWAEHQVGSAQDLGSFLYIAVGTGIGHALVLEGKLWRGAHQAANVFGHLKAILGGKPCYCGQRGCLCQYFSGKALSEENPSPEELKKRWGTFALAVGNALNLLDLEGVILSGGVFAHFDLPLGELAAILQDNVYPEMRPIVVRKSALGEQAQLVGAMLQALDRLAKAHREGGTGT